jgi:hypothetical protein
VSIQIDSARNALQRFDFKTLFVEELGWDHHSGSLDVQLDGLTYQLKAIAHKRGMAVYLCPTPPDQDASRANPTHVVSTPTTAAIPVKP